MAKFQPEEEISWVYHPIMGVFAERGYMKHTEIFRWNPELLEKGGTGQDNTCSFDPPRGYVRIDRTKNELVFAKYDQYCNAHPADAAALDVELRRRFGIPKHLKTKLYGEKRHWSHDNGFEYKG